MKNTIIGIVLTVLLFVFALPYAANAQLLRKPYTLNLTANQMNLVKSAKGKVLIKFTDSQIKAMEKFYGKPIKIRQIEVEVKLIQKNQLVLQPSFLGLET